MYGILIFVHLLVSVLLILVVLIQQPQKGGMAAIMGGGESLFGSGGAAPFMTKITAALAVLFMLTSVSLVLIAARRGRVPTPTRSAPTQPAPSLPTEPGTEEGGF